MSPVFGLRTAMQRAFVANGFHRTGVCITLNAVTIRTFSRSLRPALKARRGTGPVVNL
jgi:hypothetical protein